VERLKLGQKTVNVLCRLLVEVGRHSSKLGLLRESGIHIYNLVGWFGSRVWRQQQGTPTTPGILSALAAAMT
jgi:hypothetical protein